MNETHDKAAKSAHVNLQVHPTDAAAQGRVRQLEAEIADLKSENAALKNENATLRIQHGAPRNQSKPRMLAPPQRQFRRDQQDGI